MEKKIHWPDIHFGPINLFNLPPAWYFYRTREEKETAFRGFSVTRTESISKEVSKIIGDR